jgi:hypothetical protein
MSGREAAATTPSEIKNGGKLQQVAAGENSSGVRRKKNRFDL